MPPRPRAAPSRLDPASLVVLAGFAAAWAIAAALRGVPAWIGLLDLVASVACALLYAIDKSASRAGRDRVPEATLLWLGAAGGWPGAIVAQQLLRHKTVKRSFRVRFWLAVAANVAVFAGVTLLARP